MQSKDPADYICANTTKIMLSICLVKMAASARYLQQTGREKASFSGDKDGQGRINIRPVHKGRPQSGRGGLSMWTRMRGFLQMRTSALFDPKNIGFFKIYGVSAQTRGQCFAILCGRLLWTAPYGTFRSARAWGSLAPQSEYVLKDTLILVKNLCQNLEQNDQMFMRKSESAKDPAPCGESFEKAFISNIQVGV